VATYLARPVRNRILAQVADIERPECLREIMLDIVFWSGQLVYPSRADVAPRKNPENGRDIGTRRLSS
jgi:hypothetical protein